VFATTEPTVCAVNLTPDYAFVPKVASQKLPDGRMVSKPLEDMFPFLPPEELEQNRFSSLLKSPLPWGEGTDRYAATDHR